MVVVVVFMAAGEDEEWDMWEGVNDIRHGGDGGIGGVSKQMVGRKSNNYLLLLGKNIFLDFFFLMF